MNMELYYRVLFTVRCMAKVVIFLNAMDAAKVAMEVCVRVSYPGPKRTYE